MGEDLRAVISIGGSLQIFSGNIDVVSMGYRRQSVAILGSEVQEKQARASRIACQMRSLVAGMSRLLTPRKRWRARNPRH
jgi:hypothetical protein